MAVWRLTKLYNLKVAPEFSIWKTLFEVQRIFKRERLWISNYQYNSPGPHERVIFKLNSGLLLFTWQERLLACRMGGIKIASHNVRLRVDEIKCTHSSPHSWHWKARPLSFPFEVTTLAVRSSWLTDQLNQGGKLKRGWFECELQDVSSQRRF